MIGYMLLDKIYKQVMHSRVPISQDSICNKSGEDFFTLFGEYEYGSLQTQKVHGEADAFWLWESLPHSRTEGQEVTVSSCDRRRGRYITYMDMQGRRLVSTCLLASYTGYTYLYV